MSKKDEYEFGRLTKTLLIYGGTLVFIGHALLAIVGFIVGLILVIVGDPVSSIWNMVWLLVSFPVALIVGNPIFL